MRLLATTVAALLLCAAPAAAETYTVTGVADTQGSCLGASCTSVRAALSQAAENPGPDTVQLGTGTLELVDGPLLVGSDVTLRGAGARSTTIVAAAASRVLEINGVTATIADLTVRGGTATADNGFHGGNIRSQSAVTVLERVVVTGGRAFSGGGVANRNGTMEIRDSLIADNQAPDGGGDGGGIINFGGDGGAPAALTVRNSTVAFNSARLTGGIIQYDNPADALRLESATIAHNSTGDRGGAGGVSAGNVTARGSLIADNGLNCAITTPVSEGTNVDADGSCGFAGPSDRNGQPANLAAALQDLGGPMLVLPFALPSAAFDIGGVCPATDQLGAPRPRGAGCDAGAWEYPVAADPVPTPTPAPPVATPTPTPRANRSVQATAVKGKVLVRLPGSSRFVALDAAVIRNGAEVDARKGSVEITTAAKEKATFSQGIFKVSQSRGLTTLTLSEKLSCPKARRASAAAKKVKTRKLFGDGKGRFRTKGQYGAATVRGTRWLVRDTCTTTFFQVRQGVVAVRDDVKKKTVTLRRGGTYTARAKKK